MSEAPITYAGRLPAKYASYCLFAGWHQYIADIARDYHNGDTDAALASILAEHRASKAGVFRTCVRDGAKQTAKEAEGGQ